MVTNSGHYASPNTVKFMRGGDFSINKQEVKKMEIFPRDIEKVAKMPLIKTRISRSRDGNKIIHRTVITDIKDRKYYEKVLQGDGLSENFNDSEEVE